MKSSPRRDWIALPRRALILFVTVVLVGFLALPALAGFLGPDRTSTAFVEVRDPDHDVWTLTHVDPADGLADVCLIIHTCEEHPSVERQLALCGWVADNSGCDRAYKIEEQTVTLPEATISGELHNCSLHNGWCSTSPKLRLTAAEPLADEFIHLIEGTRNGVPFACADEAVECEVELLEGSNEFEFWALSSYGDSSQMGTLSAQLDTLPPLSAFNSPPEGSVVWVSGVLGLAGSSIDAGSGVVEAELSLNGGASWSPLTLGPGGNWSYSWDTSVVPDGTYRVLVQASDLAGHLESTARITVHVDRTPPSVNIPDSWYIWEPLAIAVDDGGVGLETVKLTIDGGLYGVRTYQWSPGNVPDDFIWDRRFGQVIAPIGEYSVTVQAWDALGNGSSATGLIAIPAPDTEAQAAFVAQTEPTPTAIPAPKAPPQVSSLIIIPTPANEPLAALALEEAARPATAGEPDIAASTARPASRTPLLWGAAAVAAAGAATSYALSRRSQRQQAIEEKRKEAADRESPPTFAHRLRSLRQQAEARVAPIRAGMLAAAAAAAKAAQEIQQRRKVQYRLAQNLDRLERLESQTTPPEQAVAWQSPDAELNATFQLGRIYSSAQLRGEVQLLSGTETPTPEPVSVGTPDPIGSPDRPTVAPVPTPPLPPGYVPSDLDIFSLEGKWIGRSGSLLNSAGRAITASAVQYEVLEGGRIVVSAPLRAPGTRADFLSRYFLRGGQYTRPTLSQVGLRAFTLRNLAGRARGTIGVGLVTSIVSNLWDYTVGTQRETGILSKEFAISTGVDFALSVGTGLTAALGVALFTAAFAISAPVWATIGAAAIVGIGIGLALDATGVGAALKRGVNEGLAAWPGILQNGRVIAQVVGERISALTSKAAGTVADAAVRAAETVGTAAREATQAVASTAHRASEAARGVVGTAAGTMQQAAGDVLHGAQQVVTSVQNTASQAIDSAREFLGSLFGGGD